MFFIYVIKERFSFTKTFESGSDVSYSHTEEYGRFSKNTFYIVVYLLADGVMVRRKEVGTVKTRSFFEEYSEVNDELL
jgi:hypothetical protein